jgi:hypothetical protein
VLVDFIEAVAILAEIGDEGGIDAKGEKTVAERGFGGFLFGGVTAIGDGSVVVFEQFQEGIGIGADVFLDAVGDLVERYGESGLAMAQLDGTGGGGDAFKIDRNGFQSGPE